MENLVWERVLVDWVNCLKLSKPIQDLNDLRDVSFFSNLNKVIHKSGDINEDLLECLLDVLKMHYPLFNLTNVYAKLDSIQRKDLSALTSLLMHYTCIHDRRDILTSPLCHQLKPMAQMYIKNFLEKVQDSSSLTIEKLAKVIENCVEEIKENESNNKMQIPQLNNMIATKCSPLQGILNTPLSKSSRYIEKGKEMAKLKCDLELALDEKENLEEDLRKQVEKNKKLENQLTMKSEEISRLRNEVLSLEERTPPNFQDVNFRDSQKLLRTQINSLEHIIDQCDKENEELRTERDALKKQVKLIEAQSKAYMGKLNDTDNKLQILTEHSTEQEAKYNALRRHCDELEGQLKELKRRSCNESLVDESFQFADNLKPFQGFPSYEDLAHSVVDIQLREKQVENDELSKMLEQAQKELDDITVEKQALLVEKEALTEECKNMKNTVEFSNRKLEAIEIKLNDSTAEVKRLIKKLDDTNEEKDALAEELRSTTTRLSKYVSVSEKLEVEFRKAKKENEDVSESLSKITAEKDELFEKLKAAQLDLDRQNLSNENLAHEVSDILIQNEQLKQLIEKIEFENVIASEVLASTVAEKEELSKTLHMVQEDLQRNLREKEELISCNQLMLTDKIKIKETLDLLQKENEALSSTLNTVRTSLDTEIVKNEKISIQLSDVTKYHEITVQNMQLETEKLTEHLTVLEANNVELEKTLDAANSDLQIQRAENDLLLQKISTMSLEKENLERTCESIKEHETTLSENLKVLEIKLEKNQSNLKFTSDELALATSTIKILKKDLKDRDSQVEELSKELSAIRASCMKHTKKLEELLEENSELNERLSDALEKNEVAEQLLEELQCEKEQLLVKVELTMLEIRGLRQELAATEQGMRKTIDNLRSSQEENMLKMQDFTHQISNLAIEKSELKTLLQKALSETSTISDTLNSALLEKANLTDNLKIKKSELDRARRETQEISENLSSITAMYENVRENLEWETLEKNRLAESQVSLLCEKEYLMQSLNDRNTEMVNMKEDYDILSKTLETIKSHFAEDTIDDESLLATVSETIKENKELKTKLDSMESVNQDLSGKLENIESKCKEVISESKILSDKLESSSSKVEELERNISQINSEQDNLLESLTSTVSENQELSAALKKLQETLECTMAEKNVLSEKLSSVSVMNEELEAKLVSLSLENARASESLSVSTVEKTHLENRLTANVQILEDQQTEIEQLKKKLVDAETEISGLKEQKTILGENVESLQRNLEISCKEKQEISDRISELTSENEELKQEVNYIASLHEELSSSLSNLSSKHEVICSENNKLSEQLLNLQVQNKELSDEINKKQIETDKSINLILAEKEELNAKLEMAEGENYNLLEKLRKQESDAIIAESNKMLELNHNLTDVKSELAKKLLEFNALSEQLSNATKRNEELQNIFEQNKKLETDLETALAEKTTALKALEDTELRYQKVLSESEQNEKLNVELKNVISEKVALESLLFEKDRQLEDVRNELQNNINEWSKKYEKLLSEKDETIKTLQSVMSEKTNLFNELEALQDQLNEKKVLFEKITLENEDITKEFESVKKTLEKLNAEKELLQLEKKEISRKVKEENDHLQKTVEKLEREKAVVENFLDLNNNEIQKLTQEKEEILNALVLSNKEVENAKEFLQKQLLGLAYRPIPNETLEDIEKLKSELILVLNEILHENKTLHGEIDKLSDSLTQNQQNANKYEKIAQEKSEILQKVSQENNEICEVVERLSKEHSEIAEALEFRTKELDACVQEKNQLLQTVDSLTQKYKQLEDDRIEILENHQKSIEINMDLSNRVKAVEKEKQLLESELRKVREAYAKVVSTSAKFELESVNLKKKIKEADEEIVSQSQIKEAYEKLLEENNKFMTELDTSKYKRSRDREEFVRLLKKERQEAESRTMEAVKGIRNEYEVKMENMKEKMKLLLKEVENLKRNLQESQKRQSIQSRHASLSRSVQAPASRSLHSSVESLSSNHSQSSRLSSRHNSLLSARQLKSASSVQEAARNRTATFARPKSVMSVDETVTVTRRTSVTQMSASNLAPNLEMEDEDDDFNNKYLTDLKAGRCTVPASDKESNGVRMSELAWRNSMLPPHLKSSYPAEMQFVSPSRFKEEDLKSGNIDQLDDSLCRLLPGERGSRQKKDFGTTSYKKPGPPTPSKNGGRLSLQSNEIQPLRENNSPVKKGTPSRIKALFMGKQSTKENTERQSITPNRSGRRLSIFRK